MHLAQNFSGLYFSWVLGSLSFSCHTTGEMYYYLHFEFLFQNKYSDFYLKKKTNTKKWHQKRQQWYLLTGETATLSDFTSTQLDEFIKMLILHWGKRRGAVKRLLLTVIVWMLPNTFLLFCCYWGICVDTFNYVIGVVESVVINAQFPS